MLPATHSGSRHVRAPPRYARRLLDALTPRRPPVACLALMAVNFAVFLVAQACGGAESYVMLKRMGAGLSPAALGPEPWRLLSASYLHQGWRHLLLNFTSLLLCGVYLEGLIGRWRLLLLYTVTLLVSNTLMMGFYPQMLSLGASGGICGLLGAMLVLCYRPGPCAWWWPWYYRLAPAACCLGVLASTLYGAYECAQPGTNFAHLAGGTVGAVLALSGALTWELMPPAFKEVRRVRESARISWWVTLACLFVGTMAGRPWQLREKQPLVRVQVPGTPVSVAVPSGAAAHVSTERSEEDDSWVRLTFGEPMTEPVLVEVTVERMDETVTEEEHEKKTWELQEELYKEVEESRDELEKPWFRPMVTRLYTKRVVYSASYWNELYWVQRWVMLRGEWRITLLTVRAPGMPANWEGTEEDVSSSLVVEEPGAPRWDTCQAWNTVWGGVCPRQP
ncbi:rhomboid family intramembrane serine protease [Archangium violaceum]|uniref:rhomboid family intramembrane serine protease n=1 Tax=Archangium violaceum TaxID=83451 RepID=UPI00194EC30F|nr:rhomboid family intramembrane serine protease [Archangium violaceum]QRN96268.1 rhomboid family intramembrane serine protease [Archangium violaceum]